jgi:creatinine amidohydrolase
LIHERSWSIMLGGGGVPVHHLADITWDAVGTLGGPRSIAVLPIGAIEAHGPHLPLATDVIISEAMAREGARRLSEAGYTVLILPTIAYTPASFGASFPGTVHVSEAVLVATVRAVAATVARNDVGTLVFANSHFDPANLSALYAARDAMPDGLQCRFPDVTRKPWAPRLTDEFRSGACHAGQYETSIVLAERPDLVKREVQASLKSVEVSLSDAIREGKTSFRDAGVDRAYCGYPSEASAEEGAASVSTLGQILFDCVVGHGG